MNTVVVYAHPYDGSFNNGVLKHTVAALTHKGHAVDLIDLYADGFNPVMQVEDLKVFAKGEYADPKAADYGERLKAADKVIFYFSNLVV